jgi:hypothetical protein
LKCHFINAASVQSDAIQIITNAYIKLFEVAQIFKGFHHGKERKKKTAYIIEKIQVNKQINALLSSLSK